MRLAVVLIAIAIAITLVALDLFYRPDDRCARECYESIFAGNELRGDDLADAVLECVNACVTRKTR